MNTVKNIFSYKKYWAHKLGTAPIMPVTRAEMDKLNWTECDIIIITGDAYIDHPAFGTAIIARVLEAQGFRVGIIPQPNIHNDQDFVRLGHPKLFWAINAGNMDSMVNHYTSLKKKRSDDAYSPDNKAGKRPDRAIITYTQICRRLSPERPIIIGGIEASLRRIAHYDYWSDTIMPSILMDSKADLLSFANGERSIIHIAHELSFKKTTESLANTPGTAILLDKLPEHFNIYDPFCENYNNQAPINKNFHARALPSLNEVQNDKYRFAVASRIQLLETRVGGLPLIQNHGEKTLLVAEFPQPLSTQELDTVYDLPYSRKPHPIYENHRIPAYDMIRESITIMRGCFGACAFCSIAAHEGKKIQSRSPESIKAEVKKIASLNTKNQVSITDLGGPSANIYQMTPKKPNACLTCKRFSCIYPNECKNLTRDHKPLMNLYNDVANMPEVKNLRIASGLRFEMLLNCPDYMECIVKKYTGGYLKIAPEHISPDVLKIMMKPSSKALDNFIEKFNYFSSQTDKKQFIIPYFIAAHPGSTEKDMLLIAIWLKQHNIYVDQVQIFFPTPMSASTTIYYTGLNPMEELKPDLPKIFVPRTEEQKKRQKEIIRYHDPKNKNLIAKLLKKYKLSDQFNNTYKK